jgi:hypothetical protein
MGGLCYTISMEEPINPMKMGWRIKLILSFLVYRKIKNDFFIFKNLTDFKPNRL